MKFVVSSSELLSHLQAISKVISSKNTLPILDNFLFQLSEENLVVTASDLETTLITEVEIDNSNGEGSIALPAKILTDTLKEFPEQPLTFEIDIESLSVDIFSSNGKFSIVGADAEDYPEQPTITKESTTSVIVNPDVLLTGINRTLFATADDELRPVMNGIFVEFSTENMAFVSSDAHKLVRYKRFDATADKEASFILPKKPASLLKNILPKEDNEVKIEFDERNAFFTLSNYKMICRLIEGTYPNYEAVIPTNNQNKLVIDRVELFNALKRVSVFSNQASNLIKLDIKQDQITVSAQDIDFSISAYENLSCLYEGEDMEIGFKSVFLLEILQNLPSTEIVLEMSDPARAGLIFPFEKEIEDEDILMLLMPMMINV